MQSADAVLTFEALSSPIRLALFRLLMRHMPDGMVAGELAAALGISATNLSFHLKTLSHAGLIAATPEGRFLRYHAQVERMNAVVSFLTDECCQGNPELCRADSTSTRVPAGRTLEAAPRRRVRT